MKSTLRTKLDQLSARLAELDAILGAPDVTRDLDRYRALTKEHSDLGPVVARFHEFVNAEGDLAAAEELAA
ncbi:MAG: PCRF domain-containing protein, partial [Burkholderiales bacterium]